VKPPLPVDQERIPSAKGAFVLRGGPVGSERGLAQEA